MATLIGTKIFRPAILLGFLACAVSFAPPVSAVSLLPGDTVLLSGTSVAARPELAGTIVEDTIRPFSIDLGGGLQVTGTVQDRIVRSTATGTLDFYYFIHNDATSDGYIPFIVRESFAGFTTDVDYRAETPGSPPPLSAWRLPDTGGLYDGSEIRFDFASGVLAPGETSSAFFVKTNATHYNDGGLAFIMGTTGISGATATISTFQPVVVPVPAAVWLFGSGLLGLIGIARRKRMA